MGEDGASSALSLLVAPFGEMEMIEDGSWGIHRFLRDVRIWLNEMANSS